MHTQRKQLATALRLALGLGAVFSVQQLAAQEVSADNKNSQVIEEIKVTGSNIKGLDLEGSMPAIQINRKDILESGADSLVGVLKDLTVTGGGTGTFSTEGASASSGSAPAGSAGVSLRGLGTSSTLTLVNGRRVSVASFGKAGTESFVDINSIPLSAIERIEILPSGASAIYGADAVAGVVNVILRDDFDGFELSVNGGQSTASSDDGEYNLNAVWGKSTDNVRAMIVADYFKRADLYERDRDATKNAIRFSPDSPIVAFNDYDLAIDDVNETDNCLAANSELFQPITTQYGEQCGYNENRVAAIKGDFESIGLTATLDVQFGGLTWFNEVMYQSKESFAAGSGASFGGTPLAVSPNHPGWANEQDLIDALEVNSFGGSPTGIDAATLANDIDSANSPYPDEYEFFTILGRFPDSKAVEVETESYRWVSGLQGQVADWDWETAVNIGHSESEQTGSGLYKRDELQAALLGQLCADGSIVDADFSWYSGDRADVANLSSLNPGGTQCSDIGSSQVWYNPFDGQTNQDPAALRLIQTTATRKGESDLYSFDFNASTTSLFAMPAGNVALAVGMDWRKEEISDEPSADALATAEQSDPIVSFSSTQADYEREQFAVYAEMVVPIADGFEAQIAARYDDYDDFGSDTNGKIGLRYEVNNKLILRANWSESFRAPSLAQAGLNTLLSGFTGRCNGDNEFNQYFDDNDVCGGYSATLPIASELVNNPDLEPETAETYGIGFLLRPTDNIELNVDWWKIEYENLIIDNNTAAYVYGLLTGEISGVIATDPDDLPTGTAGVYLNCDPASYTAGTADDCAGSDLPELFDVHSTPINASEREIEGIDIAYTQYFDTKMGNFKFTLDGSYLVNDEEQLYSSVAADKYAGEWRYPRWRAKAKVRWTQNRWTASLAANYIHGYEDDLDNNRAEEVGGFNPAVDTVNIPSFTVWDFNMGYEFTDNSYARLTVENLFDKQPNFVWGSAAGVDYSNTDIMGRYISVGYTYKF
ncbi:TonB-dependent receptor domain-containing protein [Oceanicoccus sp. KOV_DT_Chl]|uniref:TonB-dependent receptor domain-containing protein n=1 Tax=Oceanicoccus sp. KOV_DT_Chl TaxID=1904639 RepID=UPI000C7A0BF2|nr:TonB-dependent receptor [Oceanicoccus sp. KOV_DT_Chl]